MNYNQETTVAKCPTCGTPAQLSKHAELCLLQTEASLGVVPAACINATAFKAFKSTGEGADPCEHCQYNQLTEVPGTFIKMKQAAERKWSEIHQCPNCQMIYEI